MLAQVVPAQEDRAMALVAALQRLRDRHPEMTVLQLQFFLLVAAQPGLTQRELWEKLNASDTAASRILAVLSNLGDRNRAGLNLVEMKNSKSDRRVRLIYLTPSGQRLMEDIMADLDKDRTSTS